MPDLAAVAVLLDDGETFLDRCLRVDPVQVVESDAVGAKSTKALLDFELEGSPDDRDRRPRSPPFVATTQGSGIRGERRTDRGLAFSTGI